MHINHDCKMAAVVVMIGLVCGPAANSLSQEPATQPAPQSEPSAGILPIPDYSGDFWHRRYLSGDWGGTRTNLANKGVQFQVDWNQYLQGVTDGGRDETTRYGGTLDYSLNFDLMRMGIMEGALVKIRAESRYGHSVNGASGSILPVNTDMLFPLTHELDDDIPFTITSLNYTQFLSPKLALLIGKVDTLDGDPNEFASGRGATQFMDANFIFNSTMALRLPYSTLAAGVIWMPLQEKDRTITVVGTVLNTADSSTTSGFDDFGDGTTATVEAQFQYRLGDLPGGQNVGGLYSFDQDFTQLSGRLVFVPGEGLTLPAEDDTWAVYWSGWQYLCVEDSAGVDAPINLANGSPDHQGLGLFARAGIADDDTNPVEWSLSGGVGGKGIIPTRDNDTFGVAYYFTEIQTGRLSGILGLDDHTQGFEGFYNLSMTPAANLTFDVQVVDSVQQSIDNAVIVGMRVGLRF